MLADGDQLFKASFEALLDDFRFLCEEGIEGIAGSAFGEILHALLLGRDLIGEAVVVLHGALFAGQTLVGRYND